jgi:hypothetical protein
LRLGLETSSCNRGSGLQTLNLGFEEEEGEEGWDLVRELEVLSTKTDITVAFIYKISYLENIKNKIFGSYI